MRVRTKSPNGTPVRSSQSAAITHMLELGWYSKREPGSQLRRQRAKRARSASREAQSLGPEGAWGKPAVWVKSCSTVTASLPFVANSGSTSATRSPRPSFPSSRSSHAAAEVIALLHEKITNRVSSVAFPKLRSAASFPWRATASWQLGSTPSRSSRRARSKSFSSFAGSMPRDSGEGAKASCWGMEGTSGGASPGNRGGRTKPTMPGKRLARGAPRRALLGVEQAEEPQEQDQQERVHACAGRHADRAGRAPRAGRASAPRRTRTRSRP